MSENEKTNVEANSQEFSRGVEAGIHSEDTKYWQAGYELGQELSDREAKEPIEEVIPPRADTPLFLMDTLDGRTTSDLQDEKDQSAD